MSAIKHLFHITAPREKVYNALATVDGLSNWWTIETTGESNPNGVLEFKFGTYGSNKMKVKELKENELVSWECIGGADDWIGTTITFQLDDNVGKTRVRFSHDGWRNTDDFYANCSFAWGRYMESLRQLCEKGQGAAFGSENYNM